MKRRLSSAVLLLLVASALLGISGCKKKTTPIARAPVDRTDTSTPPTTAPSPTIDFSASPTSIRLGEEATLSWSTTNTESVVIDSGVGNVPAQGTIQVSPRESITYTATAQGAGGDARASARITVARGTDRADVTETDVDALRRAIEEGNVQPIFFSYDSAELSVQAKSQLEENSRWFRQYPNATITVEGHCDERGTEEYNLALGDRRAQATRSYLIAIGIDPARLEAISFGEERPFVMGHDEAAWAKNRRAHFVVR